MSLNNRNARYKRNVIGVGKVLAILFVVGHLLGIWLIQRQNRPAYRTLYPGLVYRAETWRGTRYHTLSVDLDQIQPVLLTSPTLGPGKRTLENLVHDNPFPEVAAAINGDYFDEGGPQGALITALAGLCRAPARDRLSLSFKNGVPTIFPYRFSTESCVKVNEKPFPLISCFNAPYLPGEVGVYTSARGVTIGPQPHKVSQTWVGITDQYIQNGVQHIKGTVLKTVKSKLAQYTANSPANLVIVAGNQASVPDDFPGSAAYWAGGWVHGAAVEIVLDTAPKMEPIAISGGPQILRQGNYICNEEANPNAARKHTSRTAVGITDDQKHLLVVVADGPYKAGTVTPKEMLWMLLHLKVRSLLVAGVTNTSLLTRWLVYRCGTHFLGVVTNTHGANMQDLARFFRKHPVGRETIRDAINLDGGSSSTMVIRTPDQQPHVVNRLIEWQAVDMPTGLGFAPK